MIIEYAREVLVTRRKLLTPPVSAADDDTAEARALIASATAQLELIIEVPQRGVTVDGWLGRDGLVWHVRGDLDTPRLAIVTPAAHLAATVGHMVDLGPRGVPFAEPIRVPIEAVRAQLAGGYAVLDGGIARVWSLSFRSGEHTEAVGIVDQGKGGVVWAVADGADEHLMLRGVTPLDVWSRLAGMDRRYRQPTVTSTVMSGT